MISQNLLPLVSAVAISLLILFLILALIMVWKEGRFRRAYSARFEGVLNADAELQRVNNETSQQRLETEKLKVAYREMEARYNGVLNAEAEITRLHTVADLEHKHIVELQKAYLEKKEKYDRLIREVAVYDEKLAFAEMGVYEPHFDYTDSVAYKNAINSVRELQKSMVSLGAAIICQTQWTVDGSSSKGKTMTNRNIKLTLRAFNNECEAAVANVRWNNANSMEKRIVRAQEQIDKLNASNAIFVTKDYLDLKLKELYLTHEYREKLKHERDERAEAARLAREEQKLAHDMEVAQAEEIRYEKLLEKARAEAESVSGEQLDAFTDQIKLLEADLAAAHAKVQRAQALAERTRSGYIYIVSNVGSFGQDVVKIGLTRRLDPADRVHELGDASVPFTFDTHAIIYSDDAPALERALHAEFEKVRVNTQNYRKEFFRVSLTEVEQAVARLAPSSPFFKDVEAQEYRETLTRREMELQHIFAGEKESLPEMI